MKTDVDERLRKEATLFAFRFACEDCVHATEGRRLGCSLGYPPAPRRDALGTRHVDFCKSFEFG